MSMHILTKAKVVKAMNRAKYGASSYPHGSSLQHAANTLAVAKAAGAYDETFDSAVEALRLAGFILKNLPPTAGR